MASFTKTILGEDVTIKVDDVSGRFSATVNDSFYSDDSLPTLTDQLRRALTKKRIVVSVPVGIYSNGRPKNVRLLRRSAKQSERNFVLIKNERGESDLLLDHATAYKLWTPETMAKVTALREQRDAAVKAHDQYLKSLEANENSYQTSVSQVLEVALKAKAAKLVAESDQPAAEAEAN
jgi:LmbE family N-acetylglucosaminyl deacetylase